MEAYWRIISPEPLVDARMLFCGELSPDPLVGDRRGSESAGEVRRASRSGNLLPADGELVCRGMKEAKEASPAERAAMRAIVARERNITGIIGLVF